jgi:anti-repressor protein
MQNKLEIFSNSELGNVRVIVKNGEPYFVAKDVCGILGLGNVTETLKRVDELDLNSVKLKSGNQYRNYKVVNESGLYQIIFMSNKPQAKQFKKWVTGEVLPTIRKTGGYVADDDMFIKNYLPFADDATKLLFKQTLKIVSEQNKMIEKQSKTINNQQQVIEVQKPKAAFADAISSSNSSVLIGEFAKIISNNDFKIGQNKLFAWLRENGYLMSKGERYNQPYQKYIDNGYFEVIERVIHNPDGTTRITVTTKITGKGQVAIFKKIKKDHDKKLI